jgi:hypothetical protein
MFDVSSKFIFSSTLSFKKKIQKILEILERIKW